MLVWIEPRIEKSEIIVAAESRWWRAFTKSTELVVHEQLRAPPPQLQQAQIQTAPAIRGKNTLNTL